MVNGQAVSPYSFTGVSGQFAGLYFVNCQGTLVWKGELPFLYENCFQMTNGTLKDLMCASGRLNPLTTKTYFEGFGFTVTQPSGWHYNAEVRNVTLSKTTTQTSGALKMTVISAIICGI